MGAVEEKYRDIRAEIFRFDETLDQQRKVIYARRRDVLFRDPSAIIEKIKEYNEGTIANIVNAQKSDDDGTVDTAKVTYKLGQFFPGVIIGDINGKSADAIVDQVTKLLKTPSRRNSMRSSRLRKKKDDLQCQWHALQSI